MTTSWSLCNTRRNASSDRSKMCDRRVLRDRYWLKFVSMARRHTSESLVFFFAPFSFRMLLSNNWHALCNSGVVPSAIVVGRLLPKKPLLPEGVIGTNGLGLLCPICACLPLLQPSFSLCSRREKDSEKTISMRRKDKNKTSRCCVCCALSAMWSLRWTRPVKVSSATSSSLKNSLWSCATPNKILSDLEKRTGTKKHPHHKRRLSESPATNSAKKTRKHAQM